MKLMAISLLLAFSGLSYADNNVPYYPRDTDKNQALGGINQNFNDITGRNRDNLVPIVKDNACAPGEALTGATQKNGYIFGGTCTSVTQSSTSATSIFNTTNTWTANQIFTNVPQFSSGAVSGYFAMSDGGGRLIWVPPSALPIDPILIGINVRQGSSSSGYEFIPGGVSGDTFYYIGASPTNILGKGTDVFITNDSSEHNTELLILASGTLKNLACVWNTDLFNGNNGNTVTFTVRINEADTSLTCTKTTNAGGPVNTFNCNDSTHTPSVSAGDRLALKLTTTPTPGPITTKANGSCYFHLAF